MQLNYQDQPFYLLHLTYPLKYNSTGGMTDGEDFVWWVTQHTEFHLIVAARLEPFNNNAFECSVHLLLSW